MTSEVHGTGTDLVDGEAARTPVLETKDLVKHFPVRAGALQRTAGSVHAVDGVTLSVYPHETLGIVGESGCGKSTLSRTIVKLIEPTSGSIVFGGREISNLNRRQMREVRRDMQIVFQDPYASLDPRMCVSDIVREPLASYGSPLNTSTKEYVDDLLETVGLSKAQGRSRPREFSGGQRQRIGIARALALHPKLIVLDEPVSALDVSIRAQVVNLLRSLQLRFGFSYLFVAHDLSLIRHACDRVAAMYLGKVVEIGPKRDIYGAPLHPYTRALLSAVPVADPARYGSRERIILRGEVPSPISPPSGCRFRTRCWKAQSICSEEEPPLVDYGGGHSAACHFPEGGTADGM